MLGNDTGGGPVMRWPMRFKCAGGLDFSRTPVYMYI